MFTQLYKCEIHLQPLVFIAALEYTPAQLEASKWNQIKHKIWTVLDKPNSSTGAKVSSTVTRRSLA